MAAILSWLQCVDSFVWDFFTHIWYSNMDKWLHPLTFSVISHKTNVDGLVQDCSNSSALAIELEIIIAL